MAFLSLSAPIQQRSASTLHRRFIWSAAISGLAVVLAFGFIANAMLTGDARRQQDERVSGAASRVALLMGEALEDRARSTHLIAMSPEIISAAEAGAAHARSLGIVNKDIASLEKEFAGTHSMLVDPAARLYLRTLLPSVEAVDGILTDANGYNAIITDRSSDFVQSDEAWWQTAWKDGTSSSDAAYDSAAAQFTVSIGAVVKHGDAKVGVLKMKYSISPLIHSLATAASGIRVDIVDSMGRVVLGTDSSAIGNTLRGAALARAAGGQTSSIQLEGVEQRIAVQRGNAGQWYVVAHAPATADANGVAHYALIGGVGLALLVLAIMLATMHRFLDRRISQPTRELAEAAEAVAAGDFSVELRRSTADDEIGRLGRAVAAMILELRRLAQAISASAHETSSMSAEITAGSEEMAATAGEIANTASDLSAQATFMAETIAGLAGSASSLQALSVTLDSGAREGVTRNSTLRALALENRAGLDASTEVLGSLAFEVNESAQAIDALGEASEEIRNFVTLVRKLARQSKLLALNAAMEAARAGAQGHGFAVVASEVRRLAAMSSDAAESTEAVVKGVLAGIDRSRQSAERAVSTAETVRASTARASESFAEIERAVVEAEQWTADIERAAAGTSGLVTEMTSRLDVLATGTESFAAAMQEVAASSEEQSASTEEIAGAANSLAAAAERLTTLVSGLRVEGSLDDDAGEPGEEPDGKRGSVGFATLAPVPA